MDFSLSEWLTTKNYNLEFENYTTEHLAETLRQFYGAVNQNNGQPYSKSAMTNLRSGINRHLNLPPVNRIINIMRQQEFMLANKVFNGRLRVNKQKGYDVKLKGAKTLKPPVIFGITQKQHHWMTHPLKLELMVPARHLILIHKYLLP